MPLIVDANRYVTLLGGGRLAKRDLTAALALAPILVAVDGGAQAALAHGHVPVAAVGDFDSISEAARTAIPEDRLYHIAEQDSTDFDKALTRVRAPLVLGVGFLGARLDHTMAALNTLARYPDRKVVLLGGEDVVFHAPPRLSLPVRTGTRVSLFPLAAVTGQSAGLEWPIGGIDFTPGGRVGTSNRATGPVTLDMDGQGMLVLLPRRWLNVAVAALAAA